MENEAVSFTHPQDIVNYPNAPVAAEVVQESAEAPVVDAPVEEVTPEVVEEAAPETPSEESVETE